MLDTNTEQNNTQTTTAKKNERKRYIHILLVRYPDTFSKLFRFISRGRYSHVSIGVSGSDGLFYSYVTKGFRKEFPRKHPTFKGKEVPCRLYCLEVSDEVYDVAKGILEDHASHAQDCRYNPFGLFLCLMKIAHKKKNQYFCSQFVSEVLDQLHAVPLAKHSALYLPDDFTKMKGLNLRFAGYLSELSRNINADSCCIGNCPMEVHNEETCYCR